MSIYKVNMFYNLVFIDILLINKGIEVKELELGIDIEDKDLCLDYLE